MNAKTPVEPTPITTKKSTKAQQEPEPVEPTTPESVKKPKLTYAQRLAAMDPEEAAAIRAKANAASKAKRRGTTPEKAVVERLEARLARIEESRQALESERSAISTRLEQARFTLAATEKKIGDENV